MDPGSDPGCHTAVGEYLLTAYCTKNMGGFERVAPLEARVTEHLPPKESSA